MLFWSLLATLETDERDFVMSLYLRYRRNMFNTAVRILKNKSDAEDAVQTVMVNIIGNVEKFSGKSRNEIESQIVIYIRNASINLYNRNKRKLAKEDAQTPDVLNWQSDLDKLVVNNETVTLQTHENFAISQNNIDVGFFYG